MDWAVWDQTFDQAALKSDFMGPEWQGNFYFSSGIDVIEEDALNEKSCMQVLQLLISGANAEILELEEDLIILQSQLAWTDESWSETCSTALNRKIEGLDISLRSLENADVHDEHDFGGCLLSHREPAEKMHQLLQPLLKNYFHQEHEQVLNRKIDCLDISLPSLENADVHNEHDFGGCLLSHREPEEKMHQLLQPLLENYFHQEHEQNEQTMNSVVSKDDLSLGTEKKDVAEKDKHAHAIIKDLSSDTSGQETDDSSEKKELVKFDLKVDGKDGHRKNNSGSEERSLVVKSTLKTAGKGRILPRMFVPSRASSLDASKQANRPKGKNSKIVSEVNGRKEVEGHKEVKRHNSTGQIIILKSSFRREGRESNISEPADHPVEFRSCSSGEVTEESDVNRKLTEGLDSAPTNNIEPPLSSFKVGKKRTKSPRKMKSQDVGLTNTEKKAADSLLLFLKNQKEQNGKSKLAAIIAKSNPNLSLMPQKQSEKREHQQKQKAKQVLDVNKENKRKCQSSPGVEEAKKFKSRQISLAKSCANTTASTNVEDPSNTKCLLTGDSVNSETPRPCPEARVLDLERLKLVDLRAIAKQQKMTRYSLLNKSKLTEELRLELMGRGGCT